MSVFETQTVHCPACGMGMTADIFYSINADRRPDLRAKAIDGSFQRQTCPSCQSLFRIDPAFNYLDLARSQWIAVHPFSRLGEWGMIEAEDRSSFDKAYGADASAGARAIGEALKARTVFGWPAFREKLVVAEAALDDTEIELLKMAILRIQNHAPLSQTVELRFVERRGASLIFAWVDAKSDVGSETMLVPAQAYDDIASNAEDWGALRSELSEGLFIDMQRFMV